MSLIQSITFRHITVPVIIRVFLLSINSYKAAAQVSILVNKGKFGTIEEAANADDKVNWIDADRTDDRACTESFAATELMHFLPLCTTIPANQITFGSTDKLPAQGDVILQAAYRLNQKLPDLLL